MNSSQTYTQIDLDALEESIREASGFHANRAMVLALIQRVRVAESELHNLQEWMLAAKEHVAPAIVKAIEERLPK